MRSPSKRAETGLHLSASELAALEGRATRAGAEECCGVLLGRSLAGGGCRVERSIEAPNVWPGDRGQRYEIAPQLLLDVMKSARREGLEIVGYYHSHPRGDARPSAFDASRAWPEVSYVIVAPGAERPVRAWRFDSSRSPHEQELVVEG